MTRICVVEDDELSRQTAVMTIQETGTPVVEFERVDAAIAYLMKNATSITAVFSDIVTPGVFDGIWFARMVRNNWPWIRVVLTSGTKPADLSDEVTFVPKPWTRRDILSSVALLQ